MNSHPELVRMANQIAAFFSAYPEPEAVVGTAQHLREFWDPRMRKGLAEIVAAGGDGLTPIALAAALMVASKAPA